MKSLKGKVYLIFSDTMMIGLALLIIPVVLAQNFLKLTPQQQILISIIDWAIWIAFFLEFFLKLAVAERRIKWLFDNWLDSIVSVIIIVSPLFEYFFNFASAAPILRLTRLTRLIRLTRLTRLMRSLRLIRLIALGTKVKRSWTQINLKVYVAFFFILGAGFTASFITTGFTYSSVDITWISLFISIFGVFYAVLISFFVIHVWGKFNSIGSEISREVNSLRNVYFLAGKLPAKTKIGQLSQLLTTYVDEVTDNLWGSQEVNTGKLNKKFLKLIEFFQGITMEQAVDLVIFDNIFEELRTSSVAQANLINLARDKTPKILWILLILLSTVLTGSFIFLGFQNQLVATTLISLVSTVTALVVALIFDIDTPFQAGFWNISPEPYLELKKLVNAPGRN